MKEPKHWLLGVERCHHPRCAEPGFRGCYHWPGLVAPSAGADVAAELAAARAPAYEPPPTDDEARAPEPPPEPPPAQGSLFALEPPAPKPARKRRS